MNETQIRRASTAVRMESEAQGSLSSRPMRALSLALGITALALACLAWNAVTSMKQIEHLKLRDLRIEDLRGTIVHLDEVRTMSARMAAETGDPQWEARYRKFEPELTGAIQEVLSLAPETDVGEVVARTDAANSALVQLENGAFGLIHQNRLDDARVVLFSEEYDQQKKIYAAGMDELNFTLKQSVRREVEGEIRRVRIVLIISAVALPLLLGCWVFALRTMNRWKAALIWHDQQLSRQSAKLAQLNADLDRKVDERTNALEREVIAHTFAEAQAEHFFTLSLDMLFLTTFDGYITRQNSAAERALGYSGDEIIGVHLSNFIHPDDRVATLEAVRGVAEKTNVIDYECRVLCKDGSFKWVLWNATPFLGQNLLYAAGRDITERKRAERQIFLQATALESAANAIVIADRDGLITWVNPSFTQLTGYTAEEAIGQNPRILKSGKHDAAFYQQMWQTLISGRAWRGEIVNKRKDGALYHEEMTITPVSSDGKIDHFVAIKQDVTERIRTSKELAAARAVAEAANCAKSDFLARMSHEIRTPMNGVIGMTELALDTELNPEQREYLETVKKSADTLLAVINDILDFSKIEARKLELESIPFRLRDTLDDMVSTLAARAQQKGLELICDVPAEVPDVLVGDPGRLRQVLLNLAGNAIKFTSTGEVVVRVALQSEDETSARLLFSVRDTGVGIPAEKLGAIFQPFEQADGTITRRYGGSGLGLAISAQLAELMGGTLGVESKPGEGSTFSFDAEFPLGDLAVAPEPVNLRGLPVLVVDDNETNRRILERILGSWGMQVTSADGAQAALTVIHWPGGARQPFRLALIDARMPETDGFGLIGKLRQDPITSSLPVIMMTSAGLPGDAARCRELGVSAYLTKPVRHSQLLEAIMAALGIPEGEAVPQALITRHSLRAQKRSLRVLLAEDNVVNQVVAQRVLQKWGHSVCTVNNGKEALAALESQAFDVVLMDVEMPELDGLQATAAIRAREKTTGGHLPIVAMTAHALKGDRERFLAAGMDAYVSKPVRVSELYEVIEDLISRREPKVTAPRAHNSAGDKTAFDRARALQFLSGSEQLLSEVAAIFLEHAPQLLADAHTAIASRDPKLLERAAHTLKGSLSIFGADAAKAAAHELESASRAGDLSAAAPIYDNLHAEVARLSAALAEISDSPRVLSCPDESGE